MPVLKTVLVFAAAIAPLAVSAQVSGKHPARPSAIDAQRIGENRHLMTLRSHRSSTVPAGQAELMPEAARLCTPRRASFGRYSFETTEPMDRGTDMPAMLVLRQEVECGASASAAPSPGAQTGTALRTVTPEQMRRVEEQTRLYFEAKDKGLYAGAYELMAASLKQAISFENWKGKAAAFKAKAGAVEQRTISGITWYHNPPQVEPGLYAAVDFTSKFAGVGLHCGFLAWHEQPDGKFRLVREEENYLDKQIQQKLKPDELEKVRQQFKCK